MNFYSTLSHEINILTVVQYTILYPFMNTICWKIPFPKVKSDLKIDFNLLNNKSKNSCNAYRTFFSNIERFCGVCRLPYLHKNIGEINY